MASYTHEYSRLPNQIYDRHNFRDVDDSIAPLINQIKILQQQGKYDKINEIIQSNKEDLAHYAFGADTVNAIDEEIRNLEIYTFEKKQAVYYTNEEPGIAVVNDVWISS